MTTRGYLWIAGWCGQLALLGVALALVLGPIAEAGAQGRSKSTQTEAVWLGFDAEAETVTVRVKKAGKGAKPPRHLKLKQGKQATFRVQAEGSVLQRTTVAINGRKAELSDIPEGKTVNVYWTPDAKDEQQRFARKIDVIFSDEELDEMYPTVEE